MDEVDLERGALGEAVVFLRFFEDLPDPRQRAKVLYRLDEILLLCLLAVLAGAETMTDIARFGDKKLAFPRRFRQFADGTPAHDHLGDILASLDAEAFQRCFVAWIVALTGAGRDRRARCDRHRWQERARIGPQRHQGAGPYRLRLRRASAPRARPSRGGGQVAVADKSNEIVAIPKLLDMMAIEGAVVTIDAMGCQRAIASKILDKKADYILALKGNQGTPRNDVDLVVAEQRAAGFKDTTISRHETVDGDHGRIETRTTTVIHDVGWLAQRHAWPGLAGVVIIDSRRDIGDKIERETRL